MLTLATVLVRVIVTGVVMIVPSKADPNLTRLIAPKHLHLDDRSHHPTIPDHFAFIEVEAKSYDDAKSTRKPYFRYTDFRGVERVVFLLQSEEVNLLDAPTNSTLTHNDKHPADLAKPATGEEQSIDYKLRMEQVCPNCTTIANDYFHTFDNPDKVAARMDLHGGHELVKAANLKEVWVAGATLKQPLAQEVVYEFNMPVSEPRIEISKRVLPKDSVEKKVIVLTGPADVTFGNAPLLSIMKLDVPFKGEHKDDHFALVYDMFTAPKRHALELACEPTKLVSGPGDNCIPPTVAAQDPNP